MTLEAAQLNTLTRLDFHPEPNPDGRFRSAVRWVMGLPTWRLIQVAMLVLLVVAFGSSFTSGTAGAGLLGFRDPWTMSVPLVLDVVAASATVIHGRVRTDKTMRRVAAWFVLVPMVLSWGANALDHVTRAPGGSTWPVAGQVAWTTGVIVAAGICPVAVAALLFLTTKYAESEQRQARKAAERTERAPAPVKPKAVPPRTGRSYSTNPDAVRKREQRRKAAG